MDTELIVILIPCGLLIVGTLLWQKGNHLLTNGKIAEAIIFKNNYQTSRNGGKVYYPVVRFITDKQEWITQELSTGYSPAKEEGEKLQVIYDPEDPSKVEINSPLQLIILPRLFVAIGIGGLVFGICEYLDIIDLTSN